MAPMHEFELGMTLRHEIEPRVTPRQIGLWLAPSHEIELWFSPRHEIEL